MTPYPILPPVVEQIPPELRALPQWVIWRADWQPDNGKYSKPPIDARTLGNASSTDPTTWTDFETAVNAYQQSGAQFAGVGFVVTDADDYVGVDLDGCVEAAPDSSPLISSEAQRWIDHFDSYAEISPSGRGIRIFIKGHLPPGGRKRGKVEIYEDKRFLTLTGRSVMTPPRQVAERQREIEQFHAEVFAKTEKQEKGRHARTPVDLPDDELLAKAFQARNGNSISTLYSGDWSSYPSRSEADLALCGKLAFWTGPDAARLDGLFRRSSLMREKWDKPHYSDGSTYGEGTIRKAIDDCREFYQSNGHARNEAPPPGKATQTTASTESPEEDTWGPVIPFSTVQPEPLPINSLPSVLAMMVKQTAESYQVPADAVFLTALATVSAAVGNRLLLHPRQDWQENPCLFALSVLKSSERKSPVLRELSAPIRDRETELREEMRIEVAKNRTEKQMLDERKKHWRGKYIKAKNEKDRAIAEKQLEAVTKEEAEFAEIYLPRLIVDNITVEVLTTTLVEQGGQLSVFSAEATLLEIVMGRYSGGKPNCEVLLQSYSGEAVTADRRNRSERCDRPALTINMLVQPNVIEGLSSSRELHERGLLGRFIYAYPASLVGYRKPSAAPIQSSVRAEYQRVIRRLSTQAYPSELKLSAQGDDLIRGFQDDLERSQRPGGPHESIGLWIGKLHGHTVRIAGLLHLVENVDRDRNGYPMRISGETMARAILIGRSLISHAQRAFAEMGVDERVHRARRLFNWLCERIRQGRATFTRRDAHYAHQSIFKTSRDLFPTLSLLEEHNVIRTAGKTRQGERGRFSEQYQINTAIEAHAPIIFTPPDSNDKNDNKAPDGAEDAFSSFLSFPSEGVRNAVSDDDAASAAPDQEEF